MDVQFLYDTGASCTILGSEMWTKFPKERRPVLGKSDLKLTTVGDHAIPVWGKCSLELEIAGLPITCEVQVGAIAEEAVLGLDIWSALWCHWNWDQGTLKMPQPRNDMCPGEVWILSQLKV